MCAFLVRSGVEKLEVLLIYYLKAYAYCRNMLALNVLQYAVQNELTFMDNIG